MMLSSASAIKGKSVQLIRSVWVLSRGICGCQLPETLQPHKISTASEKRFESTAAGRTKAGASNMKAKDIYGHDIEIGNDFGFEMTGNRLKFGRGVIHQLGPSMNELVPSNLTAGKRIMVLTDSRVAKLEATAIGLSSLKKSGYTVVIYDQVEIEPTDESFLKAAAFAKEGSFDAFISIGGGSVMDTAKAANLYSTYPHSEGFMAYVNKPIGLAMAPPGPLKPHIACPTTSGTGAECTGFAVCDILSMECKTGLGHRYLCPSMAIVDPLFCDSLSSSVVAASGFDVLSHALESFTARDYRQRKILPGTTRYNIVRPLHQGSNPYSDFGCLEALRLCGEYLIRAVNDASDTEAREKMLFAATLAGVSMGNAGTHLPHGLSYPVSGLGIKRTYHPGPNSGYPPKAAIIPHGYSVMIHAPSVFRYLSKHSEERLFKSAEVLASSTKIPLKDMAGQSGVSFAGAGDIVANYLIHIMNKTNCPNGLHAVGVERSDIGSLVKKAIPQKRVLDNAPIDITEKDLTMMYENAFKYW